MSNWFNNLKTEIDYFLDNATDEEIQRALDNSDYDFYKNIRTPSEKTRNGSVFAEDLVHQDSFSLHIKHHKIRLKTLKQNLKMEDYTAADDRFFDYTSAA